jgi:hypothetical protein
MFMKKMILFFYCLACLDAQSVLAQTSQSEEVAELRRQVEVLTKMVQDLQQQVAAHETQIAEREASVAAPPSAADAKTWSPAEALKEDVLGTTQMAATIFNPEITFALDTIASYSFEADNANFIVRDAEVLIKANVDPFARAYAVFNAATELEPVEKTDPFEEVSLELEEAAVVTTSLPFHLELKGGQFFADFTRLGKVHPHDRPFVDGPPSVDAIIGGETKARGFELNWVAPVPHYVKLTIGAVDNIGAEPAPANSLLVLLDEEETLAFAEDDHRSFGDVMYYGRAATIFELGTQANFHVGANYGRSSDGARRQLAGADFKVEWKPDPAGYDMLTIGGEYLWGEKHGELAEDALFEGGPAFGTLSSHGGYVYLKYRFGKEWEPGIRFDYFQPKLFEQQDRDGDAEPDSIGRIRDEVYTLSAFLSYYPSEFQRWRLTLNYVDATNDFVPGGGASDWQAFLQWTILLGPHKHEFQP